MLWSLGQGFLNSLTHSLGHHYLGGNDAFWRSATWMLWVFDMAIAQTFVLGRHSRIRRLWLVASLLGALLQSLLEPLLGASISQALPLAPVGLVHGFGWAAYSVVTGLALLRVHTRLV